jgi:hypothetical protein
MNYTPLEGDLSFWLGGVDPHRVLREDPGRADDYFCRSNPIHLRNNLSRSALTGKQLIP